MNQFRSGEYYFLWFGSWCIGLESNLNISCMVCYFSGLNFWKLSLKRIIEILRTVLQVTKKRKNSMSDNM